MGKNEILRKEILIWLFLVHKLLDFWVPRPPPPFQENSRARSRWPRKLLLLRPEQLVSRRKAVSRQHTKRVGITSVHREGPLIEAHCTCQDQGSQGAYCIVCVHCARSLHRNHPPPQSPPPHVSARRECGPERPAQASAPEAQATLNMEHATTQTQSPVQRVTRR